MPASDPDPDAMTMLATEVTGTVHLSAAAFRLLLDCAAVGLDGMPEDHAPAEVADELHAALRRMLDAFAATPA